MSALGQKQTCAAHKPMSALPPIADICSALGHVRFVPKAGIDVVHTKCLASVDHLVCKDVKPRRNRHTQCIGGLAVDD
jgi:hypothetical protein